MAGTYITPYGRFCYKKLSFGISSGPEIFQREMSQLLSGIQEVIRVIGGLLVSGKTKQEHQERLDLVLSRLEKNVVTPKNVNLNRKRSNI